MWIKEIKLNNFRNYEDRKINLENNEYVYMILPIRLKD